MLHWTIMCDVGKNGDYFTNRHPLGHPLVESMTTSVLVWSDRKSSGFSC